VSEIYDDIPHVRVTFPIRADYKDLCGLAEFLNKFQILPISCMDRKGLMYSINDEVMEIGLF
jgi:hypothetical protein